MYVLKGNEGGRNLLENTMYVLKGNEGDKVNVRESKRDSGSQVERSREGKRETQTMRG